MLALKSYEKTEGFSVLNSDELFFINGGSGGPLGPDIPGGPWSPYVPKGSWY